MKHAPISILLLILLSITLSPEIGILRAQGSEDTDEVERYDQPLSSNIRNNNGRFYAYIVLLFNENPHFVNIIQKDSIPLKAMSEQGFHVREYRNYLSTIHDSNIRKMAETLLSVYLEPEKYNSLDLESIENLLSKRNIILKFAPDRNTGQNHIILDYCIYGKRTEVNIHHPFFTINEKIYNIQPLIYYDEFSTSNSTFYFDMIYINPEEVTNDYLITRKVINDESTRNLFFVGSRITDDMRFCLKKAFSATVPIHDEIWRMFVIHELTHKVLNNRFNYFDQVVGEELSLCSTIYANPYLGLAIMYSYLNYNAINPHRIAAMNIVRAFSQKTGNGEILNNPGLIRNLSEDQLKDGAETHFQTIVRRLK